MEELKKELETVKAERDELKKDIQTIIKEFSLFFEAFNGGSGNALAKLSQKLIMDPSSFAQMGVTMHELLTKYNLNFNNKTIENGANNTGNATNSQPAKPTNIIGRFIGW